MTQSYWAIRFYLPFEEDKTIQFIGSFENAGKRYLDDIVVFSGIYGIPDFMQWYIHKDLVAYNFSAYSIDLKLFLSGDPESCYFNERYRIIDVGDDLKSDRKLVYAIHEDYAKLETLLIDSEVTTLEYKETRTVEELLKEVLEENGIFAVMFCEHEEQELESIKFEYPKFTIDPSWTVRDFIQYIAEENGFEWTVKHSMLFIGPELYTYKDMKASKDYLNRQVDNISKNYWNMKISWAASPLDVLYYYELIDEEKLTDMRCVWAKHWVGSNGDTSKGCFVQVGRSIDKTSYIQSLEGMKEITNAYHYLFKVPRHHQLSLARTIEDEGDNEFVDNITIEKDIDEYAKKTPRNVVMNVDEPLYSLPKVGRTTPYLDYKSGLLFPRPHDLEHAPNQILMAINDRIEQSVMGPFVMGDGTEEFKDNIPTKDPDAFRLQLPNGWCLYVKGMKHGGGTQEDAEDYDYPGELYLQLNKTPNDSEPTQDNTTVHMYMRPNKEGEVDAIIRINKGENTFLEIDETDNIEIRRKEKNFLKMYGTQDDDEDNFIIQITDDYFLSMDKDGNIKLQKDSETFIEIDQNDNITIQKDANNQILIDSSTNVTINTENDINLNCGSAKEVKVNSGAIPVSLEGHTHPFTGHTHQAVPGPMIPGPPAVAVTATPNIQGETDKHSKHLKAVSA